MNNKYSVACITLVRDKYKINTDAVRQTVLRLAWYIRPIRFENSIRNRIGRPIRFEIRFERKKTIHRSLMKIVRMKSANTDRKCFQKPFGTQNCNLLPARCANMHCTYFNTLRLQSLRSSVLMIDFSADERSSSSRFSELVCSNTFYMSISHTIYTVQSIQ